MAARLFTTAAHIWRPPSSSSTIGSERSSRECDVNRKFRPPRRLIHNMQFSSLSFGRLIQLQQYQPRRRFCILSCISHPHPPPSPKSALSASTKLYVSGLSFRTTEESLRNAFQNFGQLVEVNLVMDIIANRPRGFAFLRYATEDESIKAIDGMHGKFLDGRVIFVEVAKPRSELRQNHRKNTRRYF